MEVADENNEDVDWVHVPNGEVTGTATITVTADANTSNFSRSGTIRIVSDELEEEIKVVQYDEFSENFVELNNDNTISLKSSSDYNHDLATWAMELSYAAYNPISNELIPGIPSGFMQGKFADLSMTAKAELESKGFEATMFNYEGGNSVAAHVIGHREIVVNESTAQSTISMIGGVNNDTMGSVSWGTEDVVLSHNSFADNINAENYFGVCNDDMGVSDSIVLSEESTENTSNNTRQLVVVARASMQQCLTMKVATVLPHM